MPKLRVLFIHGISSAIINNDYSAELRLRLLQQLEEERILPPNATLQQISQIITFDNINYSSIGQEQEERVLRAFLKQRSTLYNSVDKIIDNLLLEQIRRELITSVSDALLYQSDYWRDRIRNLVLAKITPYVGTGDIVTLVGHSLGSVVAFDVAYYNARHNVQWQAANFKVNNLFTLGSPIALFSFEMDNETGMTKPRYLPEEDTPANLDPRNTNPDLDFIAKGGVWLNFLDAQDLIGYPLEELFKDKFELEDVLVQCGTEPLTAHSGYWQNDEVSERIAERLAIDWKKLNGKI